MRIASAEHIQDAAGTMLSAPSPMRALAVILLAWAIGSTILVGGLGAWVAVWRRWRAR
jgi:hypothetical protein